MRGQDVDFASRGKRWWCGEEKGEALELPFATEFEDPCMWYEANFLACNRAKILEMPAPQRVRYEQCDCTSLNLEIAGR